MVSAKIGWGDFRINYGDWLFSSQFFVRGKLGIQMIYLKSVFTTNSKPILKKVSSPPTPKQ
jgi:hypothetical protein